MSFVITYTTIGTENNASPVLQQITLAIVNNTQCANFYARFSANTREPIIIGEAQICAQGTTNRDACQGMFGFKIINEFFYEYVQIFVHCR